MPPTSTNFPAKATGTPESRNNGKTPRGNEGSGHCVVVLHRQRLSRVDEHLVQHRFVRNAARKELDVVSDGQALVDSGRYRLHLFVFLPCWCAQLSGLVQIG